MTDSGSPASEHEVPTEGLLARSIWDHPGDDTLMMRRSGMNSKGLNVELEGFCGVGGRWLGLGASRGRPTTTWNMNSKG